MKLEKKKRVLLYKILLAVFAVAFCVIAGILIRNAVVKQRAEDAFDRLASQTQDTGATEEIQTDGTETEPVDILTALGISVPEKNLDWDALHQENEDIYAWLYIPGTNVDYPMLQHPTDDSYYLDHNLDGSKGYPGCIYTEKVNSKDFLDANTLIYGHNMRNGTMFKTLHNFEDETFFQENRYAFIYTPEDVYVYDIFAAYVYGDDHIMYFYDFSTEEGYQEYLDDVFDIRSMNAHFRDGVEVTTKNHIITMSTCVGGAPNNRYLVQGVLINDPTLEAAGADSGSDAADQ